VAAPEETPSALRRWLGIGISAIVLVAALWWGFGSVTEAPKPVVEEPARIGRDQQPRDATLTFETKEGPVVIRSSEITSFKPNAEDGSVEISAGSRNFTLSSEESRKLTPFMQRQLEVLSALQKK
jgi:hypothetical protein